MSIRYRNGDGIESIVSGLTPGGTVAAGTVTERSGNYSLTSSVVGWVKQTITFDSPLPDDDYTITFEEHSAYGHISGAYLIENKTANGFTVGVFFTEAITNNMSGIYRAFKTYSVQHAAQNAEDIANILSVIPSNATSANKLATQSDLENVEIDVDAALDSDSENPVQNKVVKAAVDTKQDKVFVGTISEWEALSTTEQNKYQLVNLTDDGETGVEQNYATTEVKTGEKWIDGKDIYKLTFSMTNPKVSSGASCVVTINMAAYNIDAIIRWDSVATWQNRNGADIEYYFPIAVTVQASNYTRTYYNKTNKLMYNEKNSAYYDIYSVTYNTIYYTKA